jgi:hypothetical protein
MKTLEISSVDRHGPRIDSLGRALVVAMQTIDNASEAVSGRATELLPLPADPTVLPVEKCPVKLPSKLESRNFCAYRGYYYTDFTLPSEYFRRDVTRPGDIKPFDNLDFTYFFAKSADNPAHETMGEGVPIRTGSAESVEPDMAKRERVIPNEVSLAEQAELVSALNKSGRA